MSRRAWGAFAAVSAIWGVPYLFIRIGVHGGMTPLVLAWGRVTLAAVVLLALAWRAGTLGQIRGRIRWLALYAVAEVTVPFPLIAFGEQRVSSSLAAIVVASVPLIGAVLAFRFDHTEKPTPLRALGLLIGFGGVIALVGIDVAGRPGELLGTAAILIAAVGYAIGPSVIKLRLGALDPRAAIGGGLAIASLLLAPGAVLDLPSRVPTAGAIVSVIVLGLLCTAAAFVILMVLIREAGTSRAMVITYINPVVAVALGVALLGEQPGAGAVAGLLLILAGSWLSTGGRMPPRLRQFGSRRGRSERACRSETAVQARTACALAALACLVLAVPASAAAPAWTTYRHDMLRSGVDPDSTSPVAPTQVWQTASLDGSIWGSPLVYGSRVYVATENNTVYALDAVTGAIIWQHHLAAAVPSGQLKCGDIDPTVGITGTPVVDLATRRIFVVADTWNGSDASSISHQLFGLSIDTGDVAPGLPASVDAPGSHPDYQLQRPGLALDAGRIVVGYGGNDGDCGEGEGLYHGWIVSVLESGTSLKTFEVAKSAGGGAVWGAGNGLPVDGAGNVWAETGNSPGPPFDNQESVVRLSADMGAPLDQWAPADWPKLDQNDIDLGSSEPLLLPGGLVFAIGKEGVGYLLSASHLGGTGAPVFQASVCGGSFGGAIYVGGVIYVTCSDGIRALALDAQAETFAPLASWRVNVGAIGPPIAAGGLIWSAGWQDGTLYGLNPSTGNVTFSKNLGTFDHFATPAAGGGVLFVANDLQVTALRIANTPAPSATMATLGAPAHTLAVGAPVTFTAAVSPAPNAGTVHFTDGSATIAGCAAAAVNTVSGRATCTTTWHHGGTHTLGAAYSGDAFYAGSRSATLTVQVRAVPPPVLSRVHLSGSGTTRTLRLTLSTSATVTVAVTQRVAGRRTNGHCRTGVKRGRRCTFTVRRARFKLHANHGANTFRLKLSGLRAGRYAVSVSAADDHRLVSRTTRLMLTVRTRRGR
jgi:drug/metabolite transporter (DMT)-like permease/outer membrane protein assembly factor BamB